jgi:hypothetical protein
MLSESLLALDVIAPMRVEEPDGKIRAGIFRKELENQQDQSP